MTKSKTLARSSIEIPFDCFLTARATKIEACVLISQNSKTGAYHLSSRSTIKKNNSTDIKEKKNQPLTFNTLTMNCRFWHEISTLCRNLWSQMLISEVCPSSHKIGFFHSPATAQQNNCKWVQRFKIPWMFFSKLSRMLVLVSFSLVTRTLGTINLILDVTTKTVFDYSPAWFQNTRPNCARCTFSLADSVKLKHTRMLLSNCTSNPWKFLKLETTVFIVNNQAVQTSKRWTFIQVRSTRSNSDVHVMWFKLWRFGRRKYHWLPVVLIQEEFESENSFII